MARVTYGFKEVERRLAGLCALTKRNMNLATKRAAISMRDKIKKTIRNGKPMWPPLSGATIERKGSSKPLIDHGDLLNSISYSGAGPSRFFVGVSRNEKNNDGESLVNIGLVHEFGTRHVPARSFIGSTFTLHKSGIAKLWEKAADASLKGEKYVP